MEEFRCRELKAEYPFVWIDAVYKKVRSFGRVESVAVMIAYGVDREGQREVLAVEPALFYQWAGEDQPGDKAVFKFPQIQKLEFVRHGRLKFRIFDIHPANPVALVL